MRLTDFKVLTFDCYGTLIDWESGIHDALQPLLAAASATPHAEMPREALLQVFARHESEQQAETPGMLYPELLATVHRRMARGLGVAMPDAAHRRFGASVPDWPAFADTAESLRYLKAHFQLVILSNVDRDGFCASNRQLGVTFDAIYTAQDIGSYKPDLRNFHYMLSQLAARGTPPSDILHTAQSLFHDHGPARRLGLASAWIDRRGGDGGWGATMPEPGPEPGISYDFRFESLAAMVRAHRQAMGCPPPP